MPIEPDAHLETPPDLLALARERVRTRHLALRSEQAYLQWLERYVAFHRRHPRELGARGVRSPLDRHNRVALHARAHGAHGWRPVTRGQR